MNTPQPGYPTPLVFQGKRPVFRPWVTYIIMGITILVFVVQMVSESLTGVDLPVVWGAKVNQYILEGELWRLITPILLHASLLHIAVNMYSLLAIGPAVEQFYGRSRFVILYLLSGFSGNICSFFLSKSVSVGASSALFGLIAAEAVFAYRNRQVIGPQARAVLNNILVVIVINLVIGFSPGIDNWGHIGGLIGGTVFAWFAGPLLKRNWVSDYQPGFSEQDIAIPQVTSAISDSVSTNQVWLVAAMELVVLGMLVALRLAGAL